MRISDWSSDVCSSDLLRSPWTDAWEAEGAPKPLPMPLQSLVSEPALRKVDKLSEGGHEGAKALATSWVGQGVGLMNEAMGAGQVVQAFKEDWVAARSEERRVGEAWVSTCRSGWAQYH